MEYIRTMSLALGQEGGRQDAIGEVEPWSRAGPTAVSSPAREDCHDCQAHMGMTEGPYLYGGERREKRITVPRRIR
jgi:hypothetical protein